MIQNSKLHYCVHKRQSVVPIVSQFNSFHTNTSYFFKIHFIIVVSSTPRSSKLPHSFWFTHKDLLCGSLFLCTSSLIFLLTDSLLYLLQQSPASTQVGSLILSWWPETVAVDWWDVHFWSCPISGCGIWISSDHCVKRKVPKDSCVAWFGA